MTIGGPLRWGSIDKDDLSVDNAFSVYGPCVVESNMHDWGFIWANRQIGAGTDERWFQMCKTEANTIHVGPMCDQSQ